MTPTIRLIIAGSRTVAPTIEEIDCAVLDLVERAMNLTEVDDYHGPDGARGPRYWIAEVICGDARGADAAGARWAAARGIQVHHEPIVPDDIARHGKYAGPRMRNRRMAERGTHLLAFWDGVSAGTADMVTRMVARRKPAIVVPTRPARRAKTR